MVETHDLFLRALAVPKTKKKGKKKKTISGEEPNEQEWPEHVLVIDTESRLGVGQTLTFGVWKRL